MMIVESLWSLKPLRAKCSLLQWVKGTIEHNENPKLPEEQLIFDDIENVLQCPAVK